MLHRVFGGFITGKLLDSLIIGIICFVCSQLRMKMPYVLLVSVIVGVTNVIPFFGPFFGAVPSAFLILLVSPMKCLYFLIFIVLLQQFDGNILGPKILGQSTGLPRLLGAVFHPAVRRSVRICRYDHCSSHLCRGLQHAYRAGKPGSQEKRALP